MTNQEKIRLAINEIPINNCDGSPNEKAIKAVRYLQEVNAEISKKDIRNIVGLRICEHCNKEYQLKFSYHNDNKVAINNFQTCPHCGTRDDAWIKLVIK